MVDIDNVRDELEFILSNNPIFVIYRCLVLFVLLSVNNTQALRAS